MQILLKRKIEKYCWAPSYTYSQPTDQMSHNSQLDQQIYHILLIKGKLRLKIK